LITFGFDLCSSYRQSLEPIVEARGQIFLHATTWQGGQHHEAELPRTTAAATDAAGQPSVLAGAVVAGFDQPGT
jgi:hypothetical protein